MTILALDQSSNKNGWAVFKDNFLIAHGLIVLNNKNPVGERLVELKDKTIELIKKYNIDKVALEDIQLQANIYTYKVLAEVLGILEATLTELNIDYEIVSASKWKSLLCIKGKNRPEQKKEAQKFVESYYKIKATQDEVDAICIGSTLLDAF